MQIDQDDNQPVVDERFFFHVVNDSVSSLLLMEFNFGVLSVLQSTNVDSDIEPLDDEPGSQTVFAEKRPSTSRGTASKGLKNDIVMKVCVFILVR